MGHKAIKCFDLAMGLQWAAWNSSSLWLWRHLIFCLSVVTLPASSPQPMLNDVFNQALAATGSSEIH